MKKIQEIIMKDLGWKLLSVAIAVILWFMVINIEHPVDTRTYTQTISFENEDALAAQGLTVLNRSELENTKVFIKVKGQRTALDRLGQYKGRIRATVDLQKAIGAKSGETLSLGVDIKLPDVADAIFEITNRIPRTVDVKVERLVHKELPVNVEITGDTVLGFVLSKPEVTPEMVWVSGAQSIVNQVKTVKAVVAVKEANQNVSIKGIPIPYDAAGNEVKGVSIDRKEVQISIGVHKSKKALVKVSTYGEPAEGYTVGEINWTPQFIEITGQEELLEGFGEMMLPAINIQNETQSVTETFALEDLLPAGLTVRAGVPETVQVNVVIQPEIKRQLTIKASQISAKGSLAEQLEYHFADTDIKLEIKGPAAMISGIPETSVTGTVDISGLMPGANRVKVDWELPAGIQVTEPASYIDVIVTEKTEGESLPKENETNGKQPSGSLD